MFLKRYLSAICAIVIVGNLTINSIAQNQSQKVMINSNYESLWGRVNKAEEASLPQTAAENVEIIYQQALKEKNSPELIKSLIYKIKYELVVDKDRFPQLLSEIEQYTKEDQDVVEQSLLYSMLAQLYFEYYRSESHTIYGRTAVFGYVPEDIREWTTNIYIQKISEYVDLSLKAEKELQSTDILKYKKILTTGNDSRDLRPTVYDFLASEGIGVLKMLSYQNPDEYFLQSRFSDNKYLSPATVFVKMPVAPEPNDLTAHILKIYQKVLSFRLNQKNELALLLPDLDRLEFVASKTVNEKNNEWYIAALDILEKQYEQKDICVEILLKKASRYSMMRSSEDGSVIPLKDKKRSQESDEYKAKAYQICKDGVRKYPNYKRIGLLKNLENSLTQPHVNVTTDNTVYPGKSLQIKINCKNVNELTVRIYKMSLSSTDYENIWNASGKYKESGTLIDTKIFSLKNEFPYLTSDTILEVPVKALGGYEYVIFSDNKQDQIANGYFSVSRLASVTRLYDNKYEFLIVDRMSGKPVENAKVNLYKRIKNKNQLQTSITTGKDGLAIMSYDDKSRMDFYSVTSGNDTGLMFSNVPWGSRFRMDDNKITHLSLFTDRSIYRPGQSVYFKGIAYSLQKDSSEVAVNQNYVLSLRDPNGQEIDTKVVRTNDMGSFFGEFVLPHGVVNGGFSISSDNNGGNTYFQVEEYKRPGFDITFEPVKETYSFGDQVTVKGEAKTFSGVNLQNVQVKYRIVQRYNWIWGWGRGHENQISEGFVQTDNDGKFAITFLAEKKSEDQLTKRLSYNYQIEVTLTDDKGETQQSSTTVPVGTISMQLTVPSLVDQVDKDNLPEFIVYSRNLNDQIVKSKGSYEIYSLNGDESFDKSWNEGELRLEKQITSGGFVSGEKMNLNLLSKLQSGRYRMIVKANDDKGREVSEEISFLLYSKEDKRLPAMMYEWFLEPKTECNVGETTDIIYGSSAHNVNVLYDIFRGDKKIESSRFELNDNIKKLPVTFKESYGDGIVISLIFIKDGKLFTRNVTIKKAQPKKELELKMEVFRDKLIPGQKEEWKISVRDADKKVFGAEVLASMYDASLDKLSAHSWTFSPKSTVNLFYPYFNEGTDFNTQNKYIYLYRESNRVPETSFDRFNWFGLSMHGMLLRHHSAFAKPEAAKGISIADTEESEVGIDIAELKAHKAVVTMDSNVTMDGYSSQTREDSAGSANTDEAVQIRKNLNETAFFYPRLYTDDSGETLISFTVPESNTTWKFMALAHTKDLKYGQLIEKAISRKKLMISPNMPRFIRHGDKTTLTTTISNLSEEALSGKVSISFFDPATEKSTIVVADAQKDFFVEAGKTTTAGWTFDVPANIDITACKVVAITNNFSDGEQHLLPVLPNRMLVTESLPLYISGKGNKQFTMNKLVNNKSTSLENYRLTLEFANNPIWYAIQALPAMTAPSNDDVISWFAAYYANNLAVKIANSTPKIKQVIDVWTKQGGTKETLLSNLEKNQELKAVLLEETPWLMEGKDETEQKQRLGQLFDVNRSANLNNSAVAKLKELQKEDGGWAWFKGMNSDVSVTQWLLYGMAQLTERQSVDADVTVEDMQKNAVEFIDNQFVKYFSDLKKYDKNWTKKSDISVYEAEYLYIRSMYPKLPKDDKTTEAYNFYSRIALNNWTKCPTLYGRAIIALYAQQTGNSEVAKAIVASLRQHAQLKEEFGMYWPNNDTRAFMFQSATAVHTFIMEAFYKTGASEKEVNAMKLWLLKQKQTQEWESTPATVNAVSVLIQTGSNWLNNNEQARIALGKTNIKQESAEAGTGYIKQTFDSQTITSDMGKVSISKSSDTPSWGALYWQYFEDLDKISKSKTGLNVEKLLFREEVSGSGKTLVPVTDKNPLKTGDKVVVRLTVRNDRDMEYVMLKDMRAACFEPVNQISGINWKEQVIYYQTSKDASTNFYFYNLPKGTYVFEYPVYVTRAGEYSNGITTIQSLYAPEFVSNTEGIKVFVKD